MIGYLEGIPRRSTPERVLLDLQGVGYDVAIPLSTFYEIEKVGAEQSIGLFIHTHMREGTIELFGFWTEREKLLFEKLIAVGGVGPRLARVILSGLPPEVLLGALAAGDTARLATIPGIGKRTADRLVLELRDRVQELAAEVPTTAKSAEGEDLVQALVNLGYKRTEAEQALAKAQQDNPDAVFHELLRASLQSLARV
ncbi:MAG: Holliday junction branch migration protein RuvA [Acidobacteria bacterium]|nr:MAG: Holliday junction branch migration protein RuvA [Acidobacteriota bacterium]